MLIFYKKTLIKLGSQVALILPEGVQPMVKADDRVVDGETILATIQAPFN